MKKNCFLWVLSALAILFPLILLVRVHDGFYVDWNNHLWMIAYFGEYFRAHLIFPNVINTSQYVNIVYPLFYGATFYRLLGFISSVTGANIAIRVDIILLFSLQFITVFSLIKKSLKIVILHLLSLLWFCGRFIL